MNQRETVLEFFQENEDEAFSPSEVWGHAFAGNLLPLTSVRRAITDLEDEGYLTKLTSTRIGLFGRAEHYWTVPTL